ncbi:MAG: DUF4426 domain-containing protein [Oleiphilaceae bacterium]|nr:DUF4426 domain-containing protein [Oleiphilaceae bacterium]
MSHSARVLLNTFTALILITMATGISAETADFGEYRVNYNIFSSSFLQPDVAEKYNLKRSRSIGVINVSVLKEGEDGVYRSVGGQIEGQVFNDLQQSSYLGFRRVTEGDVVYYLAQFSYSNGELLTFQITANPQGSDRELPIRVTQTLFDERQ